MQSMSNTYNSTGTTQTDPPRQVWMDVARGLGVILVVFGHVLDGLVAGHVVPRDQLAMWTIYTLYTFHMPLFFFLAGLNVQHSLTHGTGPFLASKVWTVAYPYVLWSLLQGGVVMMLAGSTNNPIHPSDLAEIWYRPIAQFWFLYALMICQILVVLVPNRTVMIGIAAVSVGIFQMLPVRPDLALTLHHLPFFVAGIYLTRIVMARQAHGMTGWLAFSAIALAFAASVAMGGIASNMDWNGAASLPACALGIIGMVMLCQLLSNGRHRWLAIIGTMSMTIYVMHILASSGTRMTMMKLHVPALPWFYLLVGTSVGVIVPMTAHAILRRSHLLPAVGLAPFAWKRRQTAPRFTVATTE